MTALDYAGKNCPRQGILLSLLTYLLTLSAVVFILILEFTFTKNETNAKDCEKISDLDDKAKCYEQKKEEAEEEYSSISNKISEIREKKDEISEKIQNLAAQLSVKQAEINDLQMEIDTLTSAINDLNAKLTDRKSVLAEKEALRNAVIRNWAKRSTLENWEALAGNLVEIKNSTSSKQDSMVALSGLDYLTYNFLYNRALQQEALNWIEILNQEITQYEKDKAETLKLKEEIEQDQKELLNIKNALANQKNEAENKKEELEEEQRDKTTKLLSLEEEIARLSAKQQEVLKIKSGDENVTGYEAAEYKLPDPPFKPAFAAMSYGAFTHYKGMSQYGAKGRAESGQDYEKILNFYYGSKPKEKENFPDEICVQGYGNMSFSKYLYGIAEMPSNWHDEALKAQAVAARTYAYKYAKSGKCICVTESCQVFNKEKSKNPPKKWQNAVDSTKNEILDSGITTYYSSTTGGYVEPAGWDLDGNSWPKDAYEKKAGSPWFYKAWYTQGYRNDSGTCGRNTPWLSEDEMVDILNSWVVWRNGSSDEKKRISPETTSCWGGNPYSKKEMAEKANKHGKKFTSISQVYDPSFSSGKTTEICFETNRGKTCIGGEEFKTVFNLRAPAFVAIRSRLYDIEIRK